MGSISEIKQRGAKNHWVFQQIVKRENMRKVKKLEIWKSSSDGNTTLQCLGEA